MHSTQMNRTVRSPLWRNPDFLSFWVGQSLSEIGSRITREALPLAAVLTFGITPMTMGWLQVVAAVPVILLGLVVGVFIDRFPRRPFLVVTDLLRFLALIIIPLAAITGHLGLWMLFSATAMMATLTLIFRVAYQSYVPTLVGRDLLIDGNTKLSITQSFAEIVGPGLAGVLVQAITAPFAILIDALSYLVSAFSIWRIRTPELSETNMTSAEPHRNMRKEMLEGLRTVVRNRTLLVLAATAAMSSLFAGIIFTMDVLYAIRTLHLGAALFGFTVMFGGVGAIIGASVCQPLTRRLGFGPVLVTAGILNGVFMWLIPLAHGPAWKAATFLVGAQLLGDLFGVVFGVLESSLRQAVTEDNVLGRVNSSINLLTSALSPLGSVLGGWVATEWGLRAAMTVGVCGISVSAILLFLAPIARLKVIPSCPTPVSAD